jgi:hypothetical protein
MLVGAVAFVVVLLCIALVIAPRVLRARRPTLQPVASWTRAAGEEFAALSEAARCDLIFAVAALEEEGSQQLLVRALDDPSEAVALAAARGLARNGRTVTLERYLAARPGERARRIARTLELLDVGVSVTASC